MAPLAAHHPAPPPEASWGRTASIERPQAFSARFTPAWRATIFTTGRRRASMALEDKKADNQRPCREKQRPPQTKAAQHQKGSARHGPRLWANHRGIKPVHRQMMSSEIMKTSAILMHKYYCLAV